MTALHASTGGASVASAALIAIAALGVLLVPLRAARAQSLSDIQFHGFGGWEYARTGSPNTYLTGTSQGNYSDAQIAIIATAIVNPHLRIVTQAEGFSGAADGAGMQLDLAFAEWVWSDALRARVGLVKHPFGLYTEIHDVGTLRPFFDLPQGVYGPSGFAGEAFRGASLSGAFDRSSRWGLSYDAYVGELSLESSLAPLEFSTATDTLLRASEMLTTRDVVGGRLLLHTPLQGLSVGTSAYSGVLTEDATSRRRYVVDGSAEYLSDRWWVRAEMVSASGDWRPGEYMRIDGSYVEVAYRLTHHWQPALLYDRQNTHLPSTTVLRAPTLTQHEDHAVGLNYWFDANLVIKLSLHVVDGNRFALPPVAALPQAVAAGQLRDATRLVQIGSQFSF